MFVGNGGWTGLLFGEVRGHFERAGHELFFKKEVASFLRKF